MPKRLEDEKPRLKCVRIFAVLKMRDLKASMSNCLCVVHKGLYLIVRDCKIVLALFICCESLEFLGQDCAAAVLYGQR
ncbi:hypothetical protein AALB16_14160 [Lachnospiraceae bacterium 62-35]